ncbi:MAG TPA: hypothetical protein VFX25_31835 [Streptosporangiaceae bacterium]|nr:hypothetical protein [Streptosporangiaceae bacterium]
MGTDRLTAVIGGVLRGIGADRPVRMFLESDPETALRVMTGTRSAGFSTTSVGLGGPAWDLAAYRRAFGINVDGVFFASPWPGLSALRWRRITSP